MTLFNIRHNRRPVRCSTCRVLLAPGEGLLWRCGIGSAPCEEHATAGGGWHCRCSDERACWRRARARHQRTRQRLADQAEHAAGHVDGEQVDLFGER
jgi:hypothetical protein